MNAWARADQWPIRQYVAHEMATAGLDLPGVLRDLPEWNHHYQAIRVLRANAPLPNAPPELGDQIAPTVHGLVHCGSPAADQLVKAFLAGVATGCQRQLSLLPDPVKVKPVALTSDALITGIRQQLGPFGEVSERQVRLMLACEPATWLGVSPDPDSPDWTWNLWFGSLQPFAVETGAEYLASLEELIGSHPEPQPSWAPAEPSRCHEPSITSTSSGWCEPSGGCSSARDLPARPLWPRRRTAPRNLKRAAAPSATCSLC
jgi:hypothetical protein